MDIGLFAYWWTGIAGAFTALPIGETGVDQDFQIACASFAGALLVTLIGIWRLRRRAPAGPAMRCGAWARRLDRRRRGLHFAPLPEHRAAA